MIGYDHRGHGRSAADGKRSSNARRFESLVDDYLEALRQVRNETGRRPIALGHSMGGLIAARAAIRSQAVIEALILSGPALRIATEMSPARLRMALVLAKGFFFLDAPEGVTDGLSREPAVREAFRNDPLCINDPLRMGISGRLYAYAERTRMMAPSLILPLLVMHGEADMITDPSGSREFVEHAGSADKTLITWPEDQHEIFNELDQGPGHRGDGCLAHGPLPAQRQAPLRNRSRACPSQVRLRFGVSRPTRHAARQTTSRLRPSALATGSKMLELA